jgi:hypothetical protein
MILEFIFLCILVFAICVIAYRGAVHEFQILQRDYNTQTPWGELLNEQLPIIIRAIPKSLLGGWNESRTKQKHWPVYVRDNVGKKYKTTWDIYLQDKTPYQPENSSEIAHIAKLDETITNWAAEGFHKWYWIPGSVPTPYVTQPDFVLGVQRVWAEATLLTNTDGGPLHIWLAHGGAIPSNVIPVLNGKNPWIQTTDDIPWISEVKYIEIILRPGNTLLIPRHWYYAIQSSAQTWFWISEFHSPISWIASRGKK